jgi:hypothetical protein
VTKPDICDFCSSPETVHRYQCMDFASESKTAGVMYDGTRATIGPTNLVLNSINYWAACADCRKLVDVEDIEGLLNRVKRVLIDADPNPLRPERRKQVIRHLRLTYELFFKTRIRVASE